MASLATLRRLPVIRALGLLILLAAVLTPSAFTADTATVTLTLRPHCAAGTTPCPTYTVADPETLRTPEMKKDDTLDMDLIAKNPAQRKISRVRAWIQYNPAVLEGLSIDLGAKLPTATPGEKDFSTSDGLIKIDASAASNQEPTEQEIVVARIKLKVKSIPATKSDVLSFYDVQATGHTRIVAKKDGGDTEDILTQNPGSLLITFAGTSGTGSGSLSSSARSSTASTGSGAVSSSTGSGSTHSAASAASTVSSVTGSGSSAAANPVCGNGLLEAGEECDDGNFLAGDGCSITCQREAASSTSVTSMQASSVGSAVSLLPDGSVCGAHAACKSGLCSGGVCRGDVLKVEDGGACNAPTQCLSNVCTDNRCGGDTGTPTSSSSAASLPAGKTAFALLQVRNVRITTEGTSVYVAWDPLTSSQIKAYNLYYGSTSGRYIQRKTVSAESTSMAIRGLPEKTTYFVAIRGLSLTDEESAFSQEVAVEVGNPKTSTAPLTGDLLRTRTPVTVPGETGLPSTLALLLMLSAIAGTALASRRQTIALSAPPRAR
jgi:cysteine-rich repeat protein